MSDLVTVELSSAPAHTWLDRDDVLGVVTFADAAAADDPRIHRMPLMPLQDTPSCEVWRCNAPVTTGVNGPIRYAVAGDVMFGSLRLPDTGTESLADLTRRAYSLLLDWLAQQPQHCVWRIWNILRDITSGDDDDERYRQFTAGRHDALDARGWTAGRYPAATAIGGHEPELFILFLAGTQPSRQIENPRQVSAFHYPRQYGPRSPSFARASIAPGDGPRRTLLVSGTASVVGHASRHIDDVTMQLQETLNNLRTVVGAAGGRVQSRALKVFIRDPDDTQQILAELEAALGERPALIPLHGDVCRRELLLEIEGVWTLSADAEP